MSPCPVAACAVSRQLRQFHTKEGGRKRAREGKVMNGPIRSREGGWGKGGLWDQVELEGVRESQEGRRKAEECVDG